MTFHWIEFSNTFSCNLFIFDFPFFDMSTLLIFTLLVKNDFQYQFYRNLVIWDQVYVQLIWATLSDADGVAAQYMYWSTWI